MKTEWNILPKYTGTNVKHRKKRELKRKRIIKVIHEGSKQNKKDIWFQDKEAYEVMAIEGDDYRIVDDSGEDYLYPKVFFDIVDDSPIPEPENKNISLNLKTYYSQYKKLSSSLLKIFIFFAFICITKLHR
ncbi:hypothetical protein [Treponema phagedenis]|uniref:Uncharacterized protein n=1 Tax=Treponema phagedenis TaxID=162 RepID=A0AAE6M6M8_TREPH|nr:hypothetical protein [Treponema phagedenis]QEJ96780.1 hypothetical protein FUT82_01425 [Treponema phagedenis]